MPFDPTTHTPAEVLSYVNRWGGEGGSDATEEYMAAVRLDVAREMYHREYSSGAGRSGLMDALLTIWDDLEEAEMAPPVGITRLEAARGLLVYAAGTPNTLSYETLPCGYFPKQVKGDHPVTGDWQDDGSWAFYTRPFQDSARLYMAVYPMADCTVSGRLFCAVEE
jgi:hypothetical protein